MQNYSVVSGLSLMFILSGCSLFPPTLDEAGIVNVDIVQREILPDISFVSVYRSSDKTVIRGPLKYPLWSWLRTFSGHIDIVIEPPNAEKITLHDVAVRPKRLPKKRDREAYFVASIATDVPRGTHITVEYPDEDHEKSPFRH